MDEHTSINGKFATDYGWRGRSHNVFGDSTGCAIRVRTVGGWCRFGTLWTTFGWTKSEV